MLNVHHLHGRLVADPELRKTQSGTSFCNFAVAWSEKRGERENTLYMDVTAWDKRAETIATHFHKGKEIIVSGELRTESWVGDDGRNRHKIKMMLNSFDFCGPKDSPAGPATGGISVDGPEYSDLEIDDAELPF